MKILIVCEDLPSLSNATSFRVLNSVKFLSKKYNHNITLVAFKHMIKESRYIHDYDLKKYCDVKTIDIPKNMDLSFETKLMYRIKNIFSSQNIFSKNPCFFNPLYSPKMQREIRELVKTRKFDIVFVNFWAMLFNVLDIKIPKILEVWAVSEGRHESYKLEKNFFSKMFWLLRYYMVKNCERKYRKFDACITVTSHDRGILKSHLPNLNISVIPYGIDTDYFKQILVEQDFPSLIFVGNMGSHYNTDRILYFYNKIYPLIRHKVANITLYIVGKNPSKEVLQLATDRSVIVTGYVEDIRPYIARASVVVLPIIGGFGIKTRILEAMAMGKPVVTTSIGIEGINVMPEENILLADNPKEFARRVIELLNDDSLRNRIGGNARKLMEGEYSWEKMADKLNEAFQKVVNER